MPTILLKLNPTIKIIYGFNNKSDSSIYVSTTINNFSDKIEPHIMSILTEEPRTLRYFEISLNFLPKI